MDELLQLRQQIDAIDKEIVELFEKRMIVSENVAEYKRRIGKAVLDTGREAEKIEKVMGMAHTEFNAQGVHALFNQIMTISRMRQYMLLSGLTSEYSGFTPVNGEKTAGNDAAFARMPFDAHTKVVYSGVPGAYGHQAMLGYFGENVDSFCVPTFKACMDAIKNGQAVYGVLPIENSSTGIITDVYDLMATYNNYIVGEYVVKVNHALLACPGASLQDIKTVYSHPQGLLQCRRFLENKNWKEISLSNTAIAAKKVREDNDFSQAAIASESAARFHGLQVLLPEINDLNNNSTRFIIIRNKQEYLSEANQISICFELPHSSGTLYNILSHFIFNGLNMNRIESRPIPGKKWQYRFFIDFDGCLSSREVRNALTGIESETEHFRILGNYIHAE